FATPFTNSTTSSSPPFSPTSLWHRPTPPPAEEPPVASSSRTPLESSPPLNVTRRASSAGLMSPGGIGGSLGRSTSVLGRGGLLKKDTNKEAERLREKERRAKEKEEKAKEKALVKDRKLQRPKLSLATSSTNQLVPQPATGLSRSGNA
ncbi:hypothetical protein H0H92_001155, partial [Tricholoma furcatifolium]